MNRVKDVNSLTIRTISGLPEQEGKASSNVASCNNGRKINKLSEDAAACIIQRCARNFLQRHGVLSIEKNKEYKTICADQNSLNKYHRCTPGQSRVYFPPMHPEIILKKTFSLSARDRLAQMREVRGILDQQKSSCLVVPKAIQYSGYLVEDRLPVNTDYFHNMSLYLSNPGLFNKAVCEMVGFFSKKYLSDLITYNSWYGLGHLEGVDHLIRYDNLPLFIREENGKKEGCIGLIDLENITEKDDSKGLKDLAKIFPLHLELIKEEANKLSMNYDAAELGEAALTGKRFLQKGYVDHLNWLKNKGVDLKSGSLKFDLDPERIKTLEEVVFNKLVSLSGGKSEAMYERGGGEFNLPEFLEKNSDCEVRSVAHKITLIIIERLKTKINAVEESLLTASLNADSPEINEAKIVSSRSAMIKMYSFTKQLCLSEFWDDLVSKSRLPKITERRYILQELVNAVMENLAGNGEIFSYDSGYYNKSHERCWLRF